MNIILAEIFYQKSNVQTGSYIEKPNEDTLSMIDATYLLSKCVGITYLFLLDSDSDIRYLGSISMKYLKNTN